MRHRTARRTRRLAAALLGLGLAAGLPACSKAPAPDKTFDSLLAAWSKADFTGLTLLGDNGQPLTPDAAKTQLTTLEGDLAGRKPTLKLAGKPKVNKDLATVPVSVTWPVANKVDWTYQTTVQAKLQKDKWVPYFGPTTFHPDLKAGDKITIKKSDAGRGQILDGTGQPIVSNQPVVTVGIQPNQVKDLTALLKQLDAAFKSAGVEVDLTDIPAAVKAAKPDAFVQVVTLRRPAYDKIRAQIHDLDGTVFNEGTLPLAPTKVFARALLGSVGDVTKEIMDKNPGKYQVGDQVGVNGLQQRYDDVLRGAPGVSVTVSGAGSGASPSPSPSPSASQGSGADRVLFHSDPQSGKSIKTTLDVKIQNAADAALVGQTQRSALVAIRISDGAIVAVANGPNGGDLDLALTAQTPPGSTFKTVTALGVLSNGSANTNTVVACPKTLTVNGRTFKNAHDFELGNVPLHTDFAKSCNTAFASLAPKLGADGLSQTAQTLGIGVQWDPGIDVFAGKVSSGGPAEEQAAAAFGQGQTIVSPVCLAGAAAAVARGQWKQPSLVLDPAPAKTAPDGPALKADAVSALKTMMREVVTDGTATGVKGVPGEPIYGKTGTAEYDNDPAHTHSWFMGFRGDIAFAVFVENGGQSTDAAVPIAGKFFTTLG